MQKVIFLFVCFAALGLMSCSRQKEEQANNNQTNETGNKTDSPVEPASQQEIEDFVRMLESRDDEVREEARNKLIEIGEPALAVLRKMSESDISVELRKAIVTTEMIVTTKMQILVTLKRKSESARVEHADDRPLEVRRAEWEELIPERLHENTRKRILAGLLSEKKMDLIDVIDDVGRHARDNEDMLPILRKLLQHNQPWVRERAALYLGLAKDYESLPDIQKLLKDSDADVRAKAIQTIGRMGNKEFIPQLAELLKDENDWVRYNAVETISALGDKEIISLLKPYLKDRDDGVRYQVVFTLAKFGEEAALSDIMKVFTECKDHYWIITAYDMLNNYTFPQTYKKLLETKIGKKIEGEHWVGCYQQFLSQGFSGISIRLDSDISSENWVSIRPGSVSTRHKLPPDMSLQKALWEITADVYDEITGERIAYLIQKGGAVLIVSQAKALKYWNQWYAKQSR